jgi:hypothetical protein
MSTTVSFYTEPTNIDQLMTDVRIQFGDIDGSIYSDTIIRTALISGVRFLQRSWNGKYQVYLTSMQLDPQPSDVPSGYVRINSLHGVADILATTAEGSVFRDPYAEFAVASPPILESTDEQALILAAVYILRKGHVSSNVGDFLAWGTEDIRYNNLGVERGLSKLLENDLKALQDYIRSKIAQPKRTTFPITEIPVLSDLL